MGELARPVSFSAATPSSAKLGPGGMAVVYLVRDLKHDKYPRFQQLVEGTA